MISLELDVVKVMVSLELATRDFGPVCPLRDRLL